MVFKLQSSVYYENQMKFFDERRICLLSKLVICPEVIMYFLVFPPVAENYTVDSSKANTSNVTFATNKHTA